MQNWKLVAAHWPLIIILFGFAFLSLLFAGIVPPFEGPDEPQHFAYVTWLAEGNDFPPQGEDAWQTPVRQEASQPPLYYLLASLPARLVELNDPPAAFRPNPHFPSDAPGVLPDNKNVAVHYPADTATIRGGWLALYLARGISFLFGLFLIVSVYGLAREVWPHSRSIALAAALLVALMAQVLFIANLVSNDAAAAAIAGLTLWMLAVLLRRGPTFWRGLALGAAFGLAALSKASNLVLAAPIVAGLAWLLFCAYRSSSPHLICPPCSWKSILRSAAGVVFAAVIVAGWWYARSWLLYGTPLGLDTHFQAPWAFASPGERLNPVNAWLEVFFSFWAAFGWGNIKYPGFVYTILGILVLAAAAGLALAAWRWRSERQKVHTTIILLGLLALTAGAVAVSLEAWMRQVTAPHGRLLFPALAAIAVLLVIGWSSLHRWLPGLAIAVVATITLLTPFLLIRPAYALPVLLTTGQLSNRAGTESLDWQFGQIAELKNLVISQASVAAGEVLPVDVCWRPLARSVKDYSIMLHIVGPDNNVVAGRRTFPGLGSYPTSTWEPDRLFCDTIRLQIPADLAQTLLYKVEVALLEDESNERLPAFDHGGQELDSTFAGAVRLATAEPPTLEQVPVGEGVFRLVDADYAPSWKPGSLQAITLWWWLADQVDRDYTVFVQLRDRDSGDNIAQGDGPPAGGWYPTSVWEAGEIVTDRHTLQLPENTVAGVYDLVVGWYDLESGTRLPGEQHLGAIEVLR